MPKKSLSDTHIQEFLAIPSGNEDDQDSSDAESDDDMAKIRTTVDQLRETFTDSNHGLSPTRYEPHAPLLVSIDDLDNMVVNAGVNCVENTQQHSSNPQPSTSTSVRSRPTRNSFTTLTTTRLLPDVLCLLLDRRKGRSSGKRNLFNQLYIRVYRERKSRATDY